MAATQTSSATERQQIYPENSTNSPDSSSHAATVSGPQLTVGSEPPPATTSGSPAETAPGLQARHNAEPPDSQSFQPAPTPALAPVSIPSPLQQQPRKSFFANLTAEDEHWKWRFGLRLTAIIASLAGIGCAAAVLATDIRPGNVPGYFNTPSGYIKIIQAELGAFAASILWCLVVLGIYLLRSQPRRARPAFLLIADIIISLFVAVVLAGLGSSFAELIGWGTDPNFLQDHSYNSGYYYLVPNDGRGTWQYRSTGSTSSRDCRPAFPTCDEQDAFINNFWNNKPRAVALNGVLLAMLALVFLVHFISFVWECMDAHALRKRNRYARKQALAQGMLFDMQLHGQYAQTYSIAMMPPPSQQTQPYPMRYYQPVMVVPVYQPMPTNQVSPNVQPPAAVERWG